MEDIPGCTGPMYLWPEIRVVEGARDLLESLSKNYTCSLATNAADSSEREIWQALERGGLAEFIDNVFCQGNVGCKKVDDGYYETVVLRLGGDKRQILIVGDSLENDGIRALQAGVDAVWFNHKNTDEPDEMRAINRLYDLTMLLAH